MTPSTNHEAADAVRAPAPRTRGKRGTKKEQLVSWPRWGRPVSGPGAWHLWPFDGAGEALCMEATDAEIVWLQPGEERDPEETCNDCPLIAERHVPMAVDTGKPGVTAIAHVAPNIDEKGKAALEDLAKAAVSAMRESIPRAGKKSRAKGLTCGGTTCSDDGKVSRHPSTDPTCKKIHPGEPPTPNPEARRRAAELAAQFKATP